MAAAATASTLALRDANAQLLANAVIPGFTTTATAAGTTTMTISSTQTQVWTGTNIQTVKLPTTSVAAGQTYTIVNKSTGLVTVQSSGANIITVLPSGVEATFVSLQATPTTAAHWYSTYDSAAAQWLPRDYGFLGWSHDPASNYTGTAALAGIFNLVGIKIPYPMTVTNVILNIFAAGATLTSGQNFAGLYQNGARLALTADQTTLWTSTGLKTIALTTPQAVVPGAVYVAFYSQGTTRPSFASTVENAGGGNVVCTARYAFDSTNNPVTTTTPSTLGTLSAGIEYWAAIS